MKIYPGALPIAFNANDLTLPDAVVGTPLDAWRSIALVNWEP